MTEKIRQGVINAAVFFLVAVIIYFVWNFLANYFGFRGISFFVACLIEVAISLLKGAL